MDEPRLGLGGGPVLRARGADDWRWTYLSYGERGGKPELYDLRSDPAQKRNLMRREPAVARRMQKALADFLTGVGTPEENYALIGPVGGPDYRGP